MYFIPSGFYYSTPEEIEAFINRCEKLRVAIEEGPCPVFGDTEVYTITTSTAKDNKRGGAWKYLRLRPDL